MSPETLHAQALAAIKAEDPDRAVALLAQAVADPPGSALLWRDYGAALLARGETDAALAAGYRALALVPDDALTLSNLGNALRAADRPAEAVALHRQAVALAPGLAQAHSNLALALDDLGESERALAAARAAIALAPGLIEARCNLGTLLCRQGRLSEAIATYRAALDIAPGHPATRHHLGLALLAAGDHAEGWALYETRLRPGSRLAPPPLPGQRWQGQSLRGRTLLLYAEQGLGDTIQFIRHAAAFAALGARVTVDAPKPLVRLLATAPGVTAVLPRGEPWPEIDFHLPLMSAPFALGLTLATIPAPIPYLRAEGEAAAAMARRLASRPGPRVGLVWAGNPRLHDPEARRVDRRRSLPLTHLLPLLMVPGVSFVSVQMGAAARQRDDLPEDLRPFDPMGDVMDFADTAAIIATLDLVIGVDTAVVHLAGALGKPVWMLSRHDGCWRWLADRDDSPWYPTLRLFRQTAPAAWAGVAMRLALSLQELSLDHRALTQTKDS